MKTIFLFLTVSLSTNIFSQTVITNENFYEAISTCLSTNPSDGLCHDCEYGAMPDWDVSNVTYMKNAFMGLNEFNADISAWNVSNVTNMEFMFNNVESFNSDLNSWDVSNVSNMLGMFLFADVFNADISGWNVENVIYLGFMFKGATAFNADISGWDVGNVISVSSMFFDAKSFSADLSSWDITNISSMDYLFRFSGLTFEHYDAILAGWSQQDVMPNINLGVAGIFFCESWDARQSLKNDHGWIINDYGYDSNCTVGISEEEELSVNVYPIPTSGILKIDGERKKFKAVISDVLGKVVFTENITDKINISALDNGIYFISLSSGLKSSTHKIIKN